MKFTPIQTPVAYDAPEYMLNNVLSGLTSLGGGSNGGLDGVIYASGGLALTGATSFLGITLPIGFFGQVGQGYEFFVAGTNDADAGAKTVVLTHNPGGGADTSTFTVTGANANWIIRGTVLKTDTDVQLGTSELLLTATKSIVLLAGDQDDGAPIFMQLSCTNAGGGMTIRGVWVRQIR